MNVCCPKCKARLKLGNVPQGTNVKCPRCTTVFAFPSGQTAIPSPRGPQQQSRRNGQQPSANRPVAANHKAKPLLWILGGSALLMLFAFSGLAALVVMNFTSGTKKNDPLTQATQTTDTHDRPTLPVKPGRQNPRRNEPKNAQPPTAPAGANPRSTGSLSGKKKTDDSIGQVPDPDKSKNTTNTRPPRTGGGGRIPDVEVQFLSSVAKGKRFVIIADRSDSMGDGRQIKNVYDRKTKQTKTEIEQRAAIDLLHDELIKTVKSFKPGTQYYICFFDDKITPMPFGDTWMEGGKDVDKVAAWIKSIRPAGKTDPEPAFQRAFSLNPLPDVIFFMTDGEFSPAIVEQVARLNKGTEKKVIVNTIQFNYQPPAAMLRNQPYARIAATYKLPEAVKRALESFTPKITVMDRPHMKQIAKKSGGTFTNFVPEPEEITQTNANKSLKIPVLAVMDRLDTSDALCPYRQSCRYKSYDISLKAGKTYRMDMLSQFDTYLILTDTKGKVLMQKNDGGVALNSLIVYAPQTSGTYRLIATSSLRATTGVFALTVTEEP